MTIIIWRGFGRWWWACSRTLLGGIAGQTVASNDLLDNGWAADETMCVMVKSKIAKEQKAAERVAEMVYACFDKLPKTEQKSRLRAIRNLRIRNRKTSKRSSTPQSFRTRSEAATASRKRVRP